MEVQGHLLNIAPLYGTTKGKGLVDFFMWMTSMVCLSRQTKRAYFSVFYAMCCLSSVSDNVWAWTAITRKGLKIIWTFSPLGLQKHVLELGKVWEWGNFYEKLFTMARYMVTMNKLSYYPIHTPYWLAQYTTTITNFASILQNSFICCGNNNATAFHTKFCRTTWQIITGGQTMKTSFVMVYSESYL